MPRATTTTSRRSRFVLFAAIVLLGSGLTTLKVKTFVGKDWNLQLQTTRAVPRHLDGDGIYYNHSTNRNNINISTSNSISDNSNRTSTRESHPNQSQTLLVEEGSYNSRVQPQPQDQDQVQAPRYVCTITTQNIRQRLSYVYPPPNKKDCRDDSSCPMHYGSHKLFKIDDPHGVNTTWQVRIISGIPESLPQLLQQTLAVRFQRHGYKYPDDNAATNNDNATATATARKALIHKVLQEDGFSLVVEDSTDMGNGRIHQFMRTTINPLIGWQFSHLITRTTTGSPRRNMAKYKLLPYNTTFDEVSLGGVTNFKPLIGTVWNGVKHSTYPVRDDLYQALETTLQQQLQQFQLQPATNTDTTNNAIARAQNEDDPYVSFAGRTKDVVSFWKPGMVSVASDLRTAVSRAIQQVGRRHHPKWTIYTDIVGFRAKQGRTGIHPDYPKALLEYKIVVLCQRDDWEDHIRLFEALISGALVFSDPMRDFPRNIVNGTNIVVYTSLQDLQQKLEYYLDDPQGQQERLEMAAKARQVSLSQHRLWHRWESLLLEDWSVVDEHGISILD